MSSSRIPEATVARLPVYLRALNSLSERVPPRVPVSSWRLRRASTAPSCARTSPTSAPTAPAASGTTWTTCATRSPARSGSPRTGPSSSSASATWGTRSPTTAASPRAGSVSSRCSTPTRAATASSSPGWRSVPFDDLEQVVAEHGVGIGVIATPAGAAQDVCDRLVAVGVRSILNFAPTILSVPDGVDVRKVDLSIELQILALPRAAQELRRALAGADEDVS